MRLGAPVDRSHRMYKIRFMRDMWSLLAATFRDWYEDRAQRLGAALAYYTIFALTPGLVLVIALAGFLLARTRKARFSGRSANSLGSRARPRSRRRLGARAPRLWG